MSAAAAQRSEDDVVNFKYIYVESSVTRPRARDTDDTWMVRLVSIHRGVGLTDGGTARGGVSVLTCSRPRQRHMRRHRSDIKCAYNNMASVIGSSVCLTAVRVMQNQMQDRQYTHKAAFAAWDWHGRCQWHKTRVDGISICRCRRSLRLR